MRFTLPLALFAVAATAAPTPDGTHADGDSLLSSIARRDLDMDDVILFGVGGRYQVVKDHEFESLKATGVLVYNGADKVVDEIVDTIDDLGKNNVTSLLQARDCPGQSVEYHITSQQDFLDWDVQLSAVWGAQQAPVLIAVARGYQVANEVSFGGGLSFPVKALGISLKADFSRTWTTIDTTTITYTVPLGYYGTIISQPWTHRTLGDVYVSCNGGGYQKKTTFMADTHTSGKYNGMDWVTGVMRLCASEKYPIPFCSGQGKHE
ncbi:hypothetical protein CTA2_1903 [Colletotrichum tanaceti]|uniref:Celp0028 effector like protein n=1 Tax=Colletotrichum tanaceti TaxID=1306861 RepID=A0A4U6XBG1_9PEZI|nr:hypothetical protein CTA2_1903 [Colletotrichum tanaceti]TKW51067.1 hypothetical protein CTA1_9468 [Colletotrichum tanaceti]